MTHVDRRQMLARSIRLIRLRAKGAIAQNRLDLEAFVMELHARRFLDNRAEPARPMHRYQMMVEARS